MSVEKLSPKAAEELVTWRGLNAMCVDALTEAGVHKYREISGETLESLLYSLVRQVEVLTHEIAELKEREGAK